MATTFPGASGGRQNLPDGWKTALFVFLFD
jgi:hypothetical protein